MSGFFGILRSDGQEISEALLERIVKVLCFRGPNGEMIWTQPGVGCCFTFFFETGPAPGLNGAQVSNDSTSEAVLLHAWQIWVEHCLQRVIGDFSFVSSFNCVPKVDLQR